MKRQPVRTSAVVVLITVAVSGPGVFAQQKSIEQRLQELEQEIQTLKQQQAVAKEVSIPAPKSVDTTSVKAGSDGFIIQSADGDFKLRVGGYAQADGRFYLHDPAVRGSAGYATDTFLLRRVRPILEGTVFRDFDYRIVTDFGNGAAQSTLLQDAYVEWKYLPWLKVRGGKFKPEVGLEQLQQDTWLFFAERGLPSDLLPQRDVGFQVSGDICDGVVHYAGGVYNGVMDGTLADTATYDSKTAAARLFIQPFKKTDWNLLKGFGAGVAGTIGDQHWTTTTTNLASYKSTGQNTIYKYGARGAAPNGQEIRGTPQAYYYWGPVGLLTEYAFAQQDLSNGTQRDNVRNSAWQVEGSVVLTGEKAGYGGVTPRHPFDLKKGGWGAVELVGRYGDIRFDPTAFSTGTSTATTRFADPTTSVQEARDWGIGLNWYLNRNVKLVLDYEQTAFDGGGGGTIVAPMNRATEELILTRAQITF